ncbi:MAG: Rne/Rng family ribonuclease [Candidatus Tritonobacter lacicola]|nr:Rne/Rng family ribonuclease [Candidatus Tritonobacter lacicola]
MHKEIIVSVEKRECRVAFLENQVLQRIDFERKGEKKLIGNIYKGRVNKVIPGIQAAFVDIGLEKNGFLHASDMTDEVSPWSEVAGEDEEKPRSAGRGGKRRLISDLVKDGQDIVVQIIKEKISEKGVRLSTHIGLPGRYLVLIPGERRIGISRRIADRKERARLKSIFASMDFPGDIGFIVRTAAQGEKKNNFERDIRYLRALWDRIRKKTASSSVPSLLHEELDLILRVVRDSFTDDVDRVLIDSREECRRVRKFIASTLPQLQRKVSIYRGRRPIFERYGIEREIEKAFQRKVWLKSGGYLIIEQTEAMWVIDVNSGRFVKKKNLSETVIQTNLEAADEVARQLRLRDLGGIIVIDFIDMPSRRNQRAVMKRLEGGLKKDKAKFNLLPISDIGLLEMTRQRVKESISEEVYGKCPSCGGKGMVKTMPSLAIEIQRRIRKIFMARGRSPLKITVHPDLLEFMKKNDFSAVCEAERDYRMEIIVEADPLLHIEKFVVFDAGTGREICDKRSSGNN